jgi:hypothetical protein
MLWGICQRVANTLWHRVTNFLEGCQLPLKHLHSGVLLYCKGPIFLQYGTSEEKKKQFWFKNQDATYSLKTIRGLFSFYALSIHTTYNQSQSCEILTLSKIFKSFWKYYITWTFPCYWQSCLSNLSYSTSWLWKVSCTGCSSRLYNSFTFIKYFHKISV